jgi:hypothetical protein
MWVFGRATTSGIERRGIVSEIQDYRNGGNVMKHLFSKVIIAMVLFLSSDAMAYSRHGGGGRIEEFARGLAEVQSNLHAIVRRNQRGGDHEENDTKAAALCAKAANEVADATNILLGAQGRSPHDASLAFCDACQMAARARAHLLASFAATIEPPVGLLVTSNQDLHITARRLGQVMIDAGCW